MLPEYNICNTRAYLIRLFSQPEEKALIKELSLFLEMEDDSVMERYMPKDLCDRASAIIKRHGLENTITIAFCNSVQSETLDVYEEFYLCKV